jgi:hypothetical protein
MLDVIIYDLKCLRLFELVLNTVDAGIDIAAINIF